MVLVAVTCGCSGSAGGAGSVSIMVAFPAGPELNAFESVIHTFEGMTGINVDIEHTRGLSQELGADLVENDPPDVAALPSIGAADQYAKQGYLYSLDGLFNKNDYSQPWAALMQAGHSGGHVYTVPVKADVKSLIWYDPAVFSAHRYSKPTTWSGLLALKESIEADGGSPFCLGMASPPTSGWPGADWIADILLSQYGLADYQAWVDGKLSWTTGPFEQSWLTWGRLVGTDKAIYGGYDHALTTSTDKDFPEADGCYLEHGTLDDETFPWVLNKQGTPEKPELKFGTDYAYFTFPSFGSARPTPIQVSGDFIGMFRNTMQARKLIKYLLCTNTQEEWVSYPDADGFSADNQVPLSAYDHDDPAMRPIAMLLEQRQRELCFGAADAMPPNLEIAFDQAILEYLADPGALTSRILPELAKVASANSGGPRPTVCGSP